MALKDLLRTSNLTSEDFFKLMELSKKFKKKPLWQKKLFDHQTVVMYFNKPSTRTRLSFSSSITNLGGVPIVTGGQELQLGRGETIEDTATVISRYAKAFVIRTFKDSDVEAVAKAASIPVINALTDGHHPCQSVADLLTLNEKKGALDKCRLAYVGDGNNVTHSLLEACALTGTSISVATPEGYEPDAEIVDKARQIAKATGSEIIITHDPALAVKNADAVYTDVWLSMGDPEEEKAARLKTFAPYQVNSKLMENAKEDAIFLHCLPAHRDEEVAANIIDSSKSFVFDQAENRMHTATAILYALTKRILTGAK